MDHLNFQPAFIANGQLFLVLNITYSFLFGKTI